MTQSKLLPAVAMVPEKAPRAACAAKVRSPPLPMAKSCRRSRSPWGPMPSSPCSQARAVATPWSRSMSTAKAGLTVLLSDFQYHPLTRQLLHADFVQIHLDQPVNVEVPLELTGKAAGVNRRRYASPGCFASCRSVCLPGLIPIKITYDVTELALDGHVPVKDLALPEGVSVRLPAEQTVASVVTEIVRAEEEAAPAAGAAAAAAAPGAAAPAAGAAASSAREGARQEVILVVGLGNPGPRYAATRHNAGFMVIDALVSGRVVAFHSRFEGDYAELSLGSERVGLLKPGTFMNESGRSVRAAQLVPRARAGGRSWSCTTSSTWRLVSCV